MTPFPWLCRNIRRRGAGDGRSKVSKCIAAMTLLCAFGIAGASAQEKQESLVLTVSPKGVTWADVYKILPERADDPYFHVRVFERENGWEPWRYKELAFHMAVTPKALEASRIDRTAPVKSYKDVEIRMSYRRWLEDPATRSDVPVCDSDILSCVDRLPPE